MEGLPAASVLADQSWPKILKLVKELKRRAALVTAKRDLHDIHIVLYLVTHWEHLQWAAKNSTAHCLWLLYITITEGWPVALFYDKQIADMFLDEASDFWTGHQQPPHPRIAQQHPAPPGEGPPHAGVGRKQVPEDCA
jgi:hypothetical protein